MEVDNEAEQMMIESADDEETDPLENPFNKLAPEVTGRILGNLNNDIPSQMAASGVCRLWRDLMDWNQVKRLHLDFEHKKINNVPLEWHKWAPALEALLPKVELTSIWVTLPYTTPEKQMGRGLYRYSLFWPLPLLDCGVVLHNLITNHKASFASVKVFNIQALPLCAEFELACHLLELCTSVSDVKLILLFDAFSWSSLEWALRGKSITSLSITVCRIAVEASMVQHVAQLCQMLAPGTLKALAMIANVFEQHEQEDTDCMHSETMTQTFSSYSLQCNEQVLCFDHFIRILYCNAACLSALEDLYFETRQLDLAPIVLSSETNQGHFATVMHQVLPKLRAINFNIMYYGLAKWMMFYGTFEMLSKAPLSQPVDVTFISTNCKIMMLLDHLTKNTHGDVIHLTKEGFIHYPIPSPGKESLMKFIYKRRLPRISVEMIWCTCPACLSEYEWMKGEVLKQLRSPTGNQPNDPEHMYIFTCQIDRLKADLADEFPSLEICCIEKGPASIARIRAVGKEACCYMGNHNSQKIGTLCMGCGMMMME